MMKNYLQVVFGSEKFERKYEGKKIKKKSWNEIKKRIKI